MALNLLLGALTLIVIGLAYHCYRLVQSERRLLAERGALRQQVEDRTAELGQRNQLLSATVRRQAFSRDLLSQTHRQLHGMLDAMPSVIVGIDQNGQVSHWNSAAQDQTGLLAEQALGRDIVDLMPLLKPHQTALNLALTSGETRFLGRLQEGQGSMSRYLDVAVYPLNTEASQGAVLRIDDISLQVSVENLMVQNEKLLALGELAAGLAHEINNPLGAVIHNAQNLERRLSAQLPRNLEAASELGLDFDCLEKYLQVREIHHLLAGIREAGERAATIVKTMLEFSRYSTRQLRAEDPIVLIERALQLAAPALTLNHPNYDAVSMAWTRPDNPPSALFCVASEIQQVILNIIRNAIDALQETLDYRQQRPAIRVSLEQDENHARIVIEDNGPGMEDQLRQRIFDPFFTTKDVGRGTGLGLSICYYIVHEHHKGRLEVQSTEGLGSRFVLHLPLRPDVQDAERRLP